MQLNFVLTVVLATALLRRDAIALQACEYIVFTVAPELLEQSSFRILCILLTRDNILVLLRNFNKLIYFQIKNEERLLCLCA
jgi:hypothetical protein